MQQFNNPFQSTNSKSIFFINIHFQIMKLHSISRPYTNHQKNQNDRIKRATPRAHIPLLRRSPTTHHRGGLVGFFGACASCALQAAQHNAAQPPAPDQSRPGRQAQNAHAPPKHTVPPCGRVRMRTRANNTYAPSAPRRFFG